MRYLEVADVGGSYEARVAEAPDPVPGPGEMLVRVAASGVNRADLHQIAGNYPPPPGESPIPGLEVSGAVSGTGREVCALLAGGGHADVAAVPVGQILRVPREMDVVSSAAIPEAWLTAFVNLVLEGGLESGETLLVHAGASGVGLAAIALGRRLGARVAATTRSREKLSAIETAGAELAIATSETDFAGAVEAKWGAGAVDLVLDPVGAATLPGDVRLLATGGRVVFIAGMSGSRVEVDLGALMARRARLIGSMLRGRPREEKAQIVRRFEREVLPGFDEGRLHVTIDSIHPAGDAAAAFTRMRENKNVGKILIDWR